MATDERRPDKALQGLPALEAWDALHHIPGSRRPRYVLCGKYAPVILAEERYLAMPREPSDHSEEEEEPGGNG